MYVSIFLCISVYSCLSLDASDVTVSDKTRATPPTEGGGGGGGHYEVQRLLSQMKTGSKKPSPLHFEGPQQVKSPKEGTVAIATVATVTTIFFLLDRVSRRVCETPQEDEGRDSAG